jgi:glycerol-3-phosphate dehydrogenase
MTVDRLVEREARDAPCRTHEIPLGQAIAADDLPRHEGVPEQAYAALAARYGYAAHEVLSIAGERGELTQPIVPGLPDLLAEVVLAARREQARSVGDVLLRRTRLGLLAARDLDTPASGPAQRVADCLGRELGWGSARVERERAAFAAEARAEGIGTGA